MNLIDTHAHLYAEYYPDDFAEVVKRSIEADVSRVILPCVTSANIQEIYQAVDMFPKNLYPMIGLHPTDVKEDYKEELAALEVHLTDPQLVGIGETGIDLYWDRTTLEEQKDAFYTQLSWAKEYNFPLSIHIRDAYEEAFGIIKKFKANDLKGVMHCFSGGIREAEWAVKHGFFLGIGGVVTFKKNKLQDIIKEIGLEYLVLETDAPFLAPEPFRGKRNESAYIRYIAERVAAIFNTSVEEVAQKTTENALTMFPKLK